MLERADRPNSMPPSPAAASPNRRRFASVAVVALLIVAQALLAAAHAQSRTFEAIGVDTSHASIPLDAVLAAGPAPNGIPALGFGGDHAGAARPTQPPRFVTIDAARAWLGPREPVIVIAAGDETRIYPLQILTWHEIANDVVGGVPLAVTFCPLCNSALAFDRRVPVTAAQLERARGANAGLRAAPIAADLEELHAAQHGHERAAAPEYQVDVEFGVSGLLYNSNLLMFDTETSTLWTQIGGAGSVGALTGVRLVRYPAPMLAFEDAATSAPDATVLSRDTGFPRSYGRNPYVGYDDIDTPPWFPIEADDDRLPPKARVAAFDIAGAAVAVPFAELRAAGVVEGEVNDVPFVAVWQPGVASALDAGRIADGADVGAAAVFDRRVDGRTLRFERRGDGVVDTETGSRWSIRGEAVDGPLRGTRLEPILHDATLWFAWAAFRPETQIVRAAGVEAR